MTNKNFNNTIVNKKSFLLAIAAFIITVSTYAQTSATRKPVPEFKITSIDNPNTTYSSANLKGKVYLLDFWATWCAPCVKAFPNLQKVYDKYKSKGFEIVSLSMDQNEQAVQNFRKKRFPLSWPNAFVQGGFESSIAKAFNIAALPGAILIDKQGNIIAKGKQLEGDKLEVLLAKELSK
jgi:thiol-disulfide isomerase/thioredoxin